MNPFSWFEPDPTVYINFCLLVFVVGFIVIFTTPMIQKLEGQEWFKVIKEKARPRLRSVSWLMMAGGVVLFFYGAVTGGANKVAAFTGLLAVVAGGFMYKWVSSEKPAAESGAQVVKALYFVGLLAFLFVFKDKMIAILAVVK